MLRINLPSSRLAGHFLARVGVLALVAVTTAVIFMSDAAEARGHRHRRHTHHRAHREAAERYSPLFSSIIVDANSGTTLQATNPDALRHPASLTKIMTLYLLFERLEAGRMRLDTEMPVSEHASEQAPTKLGLHPGQSIRVEDAIKGLVTRSANDAAVVIAEAIGGDEDDFAKMMTRKARALGMSRTLYRNASGLPNDEQITTARDQATLGRAIQDRFPRYYRYFSTASFYFRGQSIRNHNHLLGKLEGVDGIKTGYTHASGFNLVTSIRRGNRHLVGVVLGGRSAGSRDAIMRNLLAENLGKAAATRTVAGITERNSSKVTEVADASGTPAPLTRSLAFAATGSVPASQPKAEAKVEPGPANGVIAGQPLSITPGSSEPIRPVKVKTVQVKPSGIGAIVGHPEAAMAQASRNDLPPQPPGHGTGNGILGVLPASGLTPSQRLASTEPPQSTTQLATTQVTTTQVTTTQVATAQATTTQVATAHATTANTTPVVTHTGWIVQVGALDSEIEAQQRIEAARNSARGLLSKANPFTEITVAKDNRKVFRARFAGLDQDQAENVCRALKRAKLSCITLHN